MFKKRNPRNPISLTGLIELEFSKEQIEATKQKMEAKKAKYKEKYSDDWEEHYYSDMCAPDDYDSMMKKVNKSIYNGSYGDYYGSRDALIHLHNLEHERLIYLLGEDYKEKPDLLFHKPNDPIINDMLINDALKTGKWKELPDVLQPEYHKRKANT